MVDLNACCAIPSGAEMCQPERLNLSTFSIQRLQLDLVCWTKLICFADTPELAKRDIQAFRYRVLHVAARTTREARYLRLRIDRAWR